MRSGSGFTLIEVLIVLAIIGLLTTLAVPNFIMYQMRAHRAEAKTNLGALWQAEVVYKNEKATFTDNLSNIDWRPDGKPKYIYGFTSDAVPAASGRNDTAELRAAGTGGFYTDKMIDAFGNPLNQGSLPTSVCQQASLVAGAAGNLDRDATLDQWTVDMSGNFTNVTDDTSQ